jgi:hypothetical protein
MPTKQRTRDGLQIRRIHREQGFPFALAALARKCRGNELPHTHRKMKLKISPHTPHKRVKIGAFRTGGGGDRDQNWESVIPGKF